MGGGGWEVHLMGGAPHGERERDVSDMMSPLRLGEGVRMDDAVLARLRDTGAYEPPPTLVVSRLELQDWAI